MSVKPEDRLKTTFVTRKGLYQFKEMPFGLSCALATFQRLMVKVMTDNELVICLIHVDDVIIVGKTFEDMIKNVRSVFDRLVECGPCGKKQVIHVDRLRLQKAQLLAGEVDDSMVKRENHDTDDSNVSELEEDAYTPESLYENKRTRKPPVWLQDFVKY